jgi:DNA modification methylase
MGAVILEFKPRESLMEFVKSKQRVSLIRRVAGRKSSPNIAIFGENLASLAALKAGAGTAGKAMTVDVIYIDPPYNVGGNQGYRNVWKGKSEKERDWAGDHGAFLDFMEPRLKIGRSSLCEEGVIFVSISDGEYCRLKILMDQIFGPENSIGTIVWNKNQGSAATHLVAVHEYVLIYAKDANKAPALMKEKPAARMMIEKAAELKQQGLSYKEAQKVFKAWVKEAEEQRTISSGESPYKLLHPKTFRPFQATPSCAHDRPETRSHRKLKHPVTKKDCKVPAKGWKWSDTTLLKMAEHDSHVIGDGFVIAGQIVYGEDETTVPRKLQYLDEKMNQILPSVINLAYGGQKDLPPGVDFSTPKPVALIKELLKAYPKNDIAVLDYFAGSAATAQAVHELNQEDGGDRSWIMIEEMGSTFHNVLLKRLECFDKDENYGVFELRTATVGDKQLLRVFQQYSFDFLSAYHSLDEKDSIMAEGMNVIGVDPEAKQIIAMTVPENRKDKYFFEEELATLKTAIKKTGAKSALIYTIHRRDGGEEPWLGVDKSILSGTSCKDLKIVEIPAELVEEWTEVLTAMAA